MDSILLIIAHVLCFIGLCFLNRLADKRIRELQYSTKKVCRILLFCAVAFYVFGYITPINPYAMIMLAYITDLICIVLAKYSRRG